MSPIHNNNVALNAQEMQQLVKFFFSYDLAYVR